MNGKLYQGETGHESYEEGHHANFASFLKDTYSEPFLAPDSTINNGYMPAKYDRKSIDFDDNIPVLYGKESHNFHRYIKSLWQLTPVSAYKNFDKVLTDINVMKYESYSRRVAHKVSLNNKKSTVQ